MSVTHEKKLSITKAWTKPHHVSITLADLAPEVVELIAGNTGGTIGLTSVPPIGCYKVTNIYVDENGKLIIKWSDTPQGA